MAKSEVCLHNEVCKYGENRSNGGYCTGEKCKQFKDRTQYVEVVLCNKCHYWDNATVNEKGFLICPASGMEITSNDFCSYGERRERMIWMTQMENIVMNLTGCDRQVANTVVNTILLGGKHYDN